MTSRHEVLGRLHTLLRPRGYLEIGVDDGGSLTLSRVPTVAVDPAYRVTRPLHCDLQLVQATSDDFFARPDPLAHLPGGQVDLAFIDGMHLFEFVLRDFVHVERLSHPGTVVVLDDMLPRNPDEAARDRHTRAWTGDVFKMIPVLQRYRPDLVCLPLDTAPTGVVLVLALDASNRTLSEAYDEIVAEWVTDDPQDVPPELLRRTVALDPDRVLGAGFWPWLVSRRSGLLRRPPSAQAVARRARAELSGDAVNARGRGVGRVPGTAAALRTAVKPRTRLRRLLRARRRPRR